MNAEIDEDIVVRLRDTSHGIRLSREAADEIERLRAENREHALSELAALGQAEEAYGAQLKAEAEIDRLQAKVAKLEKLLENERGVVDGKSRYERVAQRYRLALEARDEAEAEIERLRAALQFYADPRNHDYPESDNDMHGTGHSTAIELDEGAIARAALIDKEAG